MAEAEKKTARAKKTASSAKGRKSAATGVNIAAIVKKLTEPLVFGLDIGTRSIVVSNFSINCVQDNSINFLNSAFSKILCDK